MPNQEQVQAIIEAARRLTEESLSGSVSGEEVAKEAGVSAEGVEAYYAFREAEKRGALVIQGWRGGMGLPYEVSLP